MIPDELVSTRTLKARLGKVRSAQKFGVIPKPIASGLLVSGEWLNNALKTRELELENLLVIAIGVDGSKYKVIRETLEIEEFEVEAATPSKALIGVKEKSAKLLKSDKKVQGYKIDECL